MKQITLTSDDFDALKRALPDLKFQLAQDPAAPSPLLQRYLDDYGLSALDTSCVDHRAGTFDGNGYRICAHYWLPANPVGTTFLVHGYFDHTGLYGHVISHLLSQGQAVVAFDLPGHGLSSGERLATDSFATYQQVLCDLVSRCEHFPKPFNALGQSTGAAILLRLLVSQARKQTESPFAKIVLLAPLVRPWRWNWSIWLYRLLHRFVYGTPRRFRRNSHDQEFVDFLAKGEPLQETTIPMSWVGAMKQWIEDFALAPVSDQVLTVIQGDCDTTVDSHYNLEQIRQKFPNAVIHIVAGAMHHLVNERADIRQRIFAHIHFKSSGKTWEAG